MSAGLHDYPEERPTYDVVTTQQVHAAWREWSFWIAMTIGMWAAFQGMPLIAFWFCLTIVIVVTIKVITGPVASELSKTWRS